jgi:putative ABC transport system substrate-binding protein
MKRSPGRREFFTLAAGAAAAGILPRRLRAQASAMPVVGYIRSSAATGFAHLEAALRTGLKEAGFVEGQNVAIELHYANNRTDRLSALIADLVRRPVNVIVGNSLAALAAKAATATVPIVFVSGGDPVRGSLVASLNRPGGNVTGVSLLSTAVAAKRLELLRQLAPKATTIGALAHRGSLQAEAERSDLPAAAQAMGLRLVILEVDSEREIETAFATLVQHGAGVLLVGSGAFFYSNRERIVALAAHHALPASYPLHDFVKAGGLMSYGPSIADAYRQVGVYAGRILKGEKPADLPVMQATKLDFVLNLKTAKALGLDVSPTLLALADEVVE